MQLNEGLEKLGRSTFERSAIEDITLPSTLKRIESETFKGCKCLKRLDIPNGVEYIENGCFSDSEIREITLPSTLKEIGPEAFGGFNYLKVVRVEKGCDIKIKKYVSRHVDVQKK